jgi:hypothetical protein
MPNFILELCKATKINRICVGSGKLLLNPKAQEGNKVAVAVAF